MIRYLLSLMTTGEKFKTMKRLVTTRKILGNASYWYYGVTGLQPILNT